MRAIALTFAIGMTTGCASILSDEVYPVSVTSSPSSAAIEIRDQDGNVVYNGQTPALVKLKSNAGFFDGETYRIEFKKDGHSSEQFVLNSGVDGWYWGNILFGGLFGMLLVDPATGAMFDLPNQAGASLKPLAVVQQQTVSSDNHSSTALSKSQWQKQQIEHLQQQSLGYEDYQRRYHEIMAD